MRSLVKALFIIIGCISLALGVIAAFIPGIPSTGFLFLTLYCFTKGSDRLHNWFINSNIYKTTIKEFRETGMLTKRAKIRILCISTTTMSIGLYFAPLFAKIIIVLAMVIKYFYFFRVIKTMPEHYHQVKSCPLKKVVSPKLPV